MAKSPKNDFDDSNSNEDENAGAMFENNEEGLLVDLSNVEAMKFEVIPKGTYNAIIEDVEYTLSKSSNKPMWNVKLAITDEAYANRKLFTNLSFSEKALPGTKAALATFAPELASSAFRPQDPELCAGMQGRKVRIKVKIEKYNDEDQNRIGGWMMPEDSGAFA